MHGRDCDFLRQVSAVPLESAGARTGTDAASLLSASVSVESIDDCRKKLKGVMLLP